jgi:GNAT superfamily N-acetyltransferase
MPRGGADMMLLASWKLPTEPGRPAKSSRMVRLVIAKEAVKDYAAATEVVRLASDARLISHCRAQLATFDPNHDAPLGVEPPAATWPVDTLTLNGFYHDGNLSLNDPNRVMLRVTYLEMLAPPPPPTYTESDQVVLERPDAAAYLALYRRVGDPLGWDTRLKLPEGELAALLAGDRLRIYVLRDANGVALGFCEFDCGAFPQIELKNFGLVPEAQGRGLGAWLLAVALQEQWLTKPSRIWLHTDTWDHPAAKRVYEKAGFKAYDVRDERADEI